MDLDENHLMVVTIRRVTLHEKLGKRLRQQRKQANITQQQLGGILDCPQSLVSKVEAGTMELGVVKFVKYCKALGANPAPS
jgi:transcriptional regulator with XRE-family HTH domain